MFPVAKIEHLNHIIDKELVLSGNWDLNVELTLSEICFYLIWLQIKVLTT